MVVCQIATLRCDCPSLCLLHGLLHSQHVTGMTLAASLFLDHTLSGQMIGSGTGRWLQLVYDKSVAVSHLTAVARPFHGLSDRIASITPRCLSYSATHGGSSMPSPLATLTTSDTAAVSTATMLLRLSLSSVMEGKKGKDK